MMSIMITTAVVVAIAGAGMINYKLITLEAVMLGLIVIVLGNILEQLKIRSWTAGKIDDLKREKKG